MFTKVLLSSLLCFLLSSSISFAQLIPDSIAYRTQRGDTIWVKTAIPDTAYVPNEVIIKFRKQGLHIEELCYTCPHMLDGACWTWVLAQEFDLDSSSLIINPQLVLALKDLGGRYIKRLTYNNPCYDTLSITRYGDTIRDPFYLYMVLHLDNDTSVMKATTLLTAFFQSDLEYAQPNYLMDLLATPNDPFFATHQESIHIGDDRSEVERAWDFERGGNLEIRTAVIDDGLDFRHCELGGAMGAGEKVGGGYNFTESNYQTWTSVLVE